MNDQQQKAYLWVASEGSCSTWNTNDRTGVNEEMLKVSIYWNKQ